MIKLDDENRGYFARVPHSIINDTRLKAIDVGIMTYLLSNAPSWEVHQKVVARECRVSLYDVKASFKRLAAAGYMEYRQKRAEGGEWGAGDWIIYEISQKPQNAENRAPAEPDEESGWAAL
ncbi:MAG: hypothetical protein K5982_01500 [Selenomonadaceae bacterium]|nr:hypothetical protein [Selenomonadaceae bacterium]